MSLDFLSLKPKHQPKDVSMRMYQADFEKFAKLVDFINKDKEPDEQISPEDIFEELMKATDEVDGFSDYAATAKGSRRGRKKNVEES